VRSKFAASLTPLLEALGETVRLASTLALDATAAKAQGNLSLLARSTKLLTRALVTAQAQVGGDVLARAARGADSPSCCSSKR
jgi:hypothetical protein